VIGEEEPVAVALSTLMTTTMDSMADIVNCVLQNYPSVKIMVGGAPINQDFANLIGAHFYGKDAREAVVGTHQILGIPFED